MAKDAKKTEHKSGDLSTQEATKAPDQPAVANSAPTVTGQRQQLVIAPSAVVNIAVHSLLMITVPFVLFFASLLGGLDPLYPLVGAHVPNKEVKSYIGAGLAVLGVNLVICSFVVRAFKEDTQPIKQD